MLIQLSVPYGFLQQFLDTSGEEKKEVFLLSNQDDQEEDASLFLPPERNPWSLRGTSLI